MVFDNRSHAGVLLAEKLKDYGDQANLIILTIPRGGVIVAKSLSRKLNLPLDIIVVRKLTSPFNPELAIGAVGTKYPPVLDLELIKNLSLGKSYLTEEIGRKRKEAQHLESTFRQGKKPAKLTGRTVILVDDGLATGATVAAAAKIIAKSRPKKLILATPVVAIDTLEKIKNLFDKIVVLEVPEKFHAVGEFYRQFPQITDEEVEKALGSWDIN